jgi:HrpA-like RNA helicase
MNPRLGKMLLYGFVFQCVEPVALICAALSNRELFTPTMGDQDGQVCMYVGDCACVCECM